MTKVSIITVTFNCAEKLDLTLSSISSQQYSNFEVVVVDGGSSDHTSEVIAKYSNLIDVYISESDRGIYDAMNKGVIAASCDFLYFLNSGDFFVNDFVLASVTEKLNTDYGIVMGNVMATTQDYCQFIYPKVSKFDDSLLNVSARKLFDSHICHQAYFINRRSLIDSGMYDLDFPHFADFHSFFRITRKCKVHKIEDVISVFPLGGVSSDPKNARFLLKEKELMLSTISHESVLKRMFFKSKNSIFVLKKKVFKWLQ
ncbi:glycosyltransferase [Vibrio sp. SM6]|uniref:Glycosyltransferase n=1 Tax=Vibrio agarilyticus TaxID=2726741 RepID=A0A7X8TRJ3_9VIBR|nr:glycosyltransferase family 2 protein [Vibrio agarilyticus]NLS13533.1 glycosyltransferase [Vibrio agarilyticus]